MNCKKCNYELKDEWKICPKCSNIINAQCINHIDNTYHIEDNVNYDGKDRICLVIFLISVACVFFIKQISEFAFIIALISIVTGFIKYPKNRTIKILFWLFLAGAALYIIFIMFVLFMCVGLVSSYNYLGV